jgi:DNA invertase Pin-like site-specific DNA recombinase
MKIRKNGAKIGVLYGRVSVDDAAQVEHGSLEQQEHMGREFVKQISERIGQRMEVPYILIEEKGVSGATTKRPKYQELLRLIISEKIDFIVAKEISRLNRSIEDFLQLMRLCQQHNVALHIKGLDVDPHTPWGKMLFTFMGMLSELERDMVVNRTRESLRSAAINNAKINGGSIPLDPSPPR